MHRTLAASLVLAAALAAGACQPITGSLPRDGAPDSFEFRTSGYFTSTRTVQVRGDTVVLTERSWEGEAAPEVRVVPTAQAWQTFWAAVRASGVRQWGGRYVDTSVMDGGGWALEMRAGGVRVSAHGANAWPDAWGRKRTGDLTPAYHAFADAVGALVAPAQ